MSDTTIFFFFNDPATTEIYTLSLHDALPIWPRPRHCVWSPPVAGARQRPATPAGVPPRASGSPSSTTTCCPRSKEHTSELQSRQYLVCRLLLEKKKNQQSQNRARLLVDSSLY